MEVIFSGLVLEAVEPRSIQGPKYCQADVTNGYYGNRGALQCLADVGDVAILELQYLKGTFFPAAFSQLSSTNSIN